MQTQLASRTLILKIAYLVNTYPRPSHTFIRREIQALERQGFEIHRFAMRSDRRSLKDPDDKAEDRLTEHVLERGKLSLVLAGVTTALRHPIRMARAIGTAWRMGARARMQAKHLIYVLEAAAVARRCRALQIAHLHAHFGTNSATVACLAHLLGGPRWSYTVHGPEEFDAPRALSLGAKSSRAAFTVAVSSFGRSQLCRWTGVRIWPRLKVIHCGIEPGRFAEPAPLPAKLRLVAIGRFSEQKGFPLLIEAITIAARLNPGLPAAPSKLCSTASQQRPRPRMHRWRRHVRRLLPLPPRATPPRPRWQAGRSGWQRRTHTQRPWQQCSVRLRRRATSCCSCSLQAQPMRSVGRSSCCHSGGRWRMPGGRQMRTAMPPQLPQPNSRCCRRRWPSCASWCRQRTSRLGR